MNILDDIPREDVVRCTTGYELTMVQLVDGSYWLWIPQHRTTYPALMNRWSRQQFAPRQENGFVMLESGVWAEWKTPYWKKP